MTFIDYNDSMNMKEQATKLKTDLPALFLALRDNRTPVFAKILTAMTVAYALSPVDLIPDFIPILGYLDDVIILPLLVFLSLKLIPEDVMDQCRKESENLWRKGKPKKWYYAIPVVLIWLVLLIIVIAAIYTGKKEGI